MGVQTCHVDLWEEYLTTGKPIRLRNKLIVENMGLVHQICNRVRKLSAFEHIDYEELVQIGTLGLISAVEKFQLEPGRYFYTYAYPFVEGRLRQYLRDKCRLIRFPVNKYDMVMAWQRTSDSLAQKEGRTPGFDLVYHHLPPKYQGRTKSFWLELLQSWKNTHTQHDTVEVSILDMVPDSPRDFYDENPIRQIPREMVEQDSRIVKALQILSLVEAGRLKNKEAGVKKNGARKTCKNSG